MSIDNIKVEKLTKDDYYHGFLELLEELTVVNVNEITFEDFCKQFDDMKSEVFVIKDKSKIIGTASVLIENKFIHKLGSVCHIEDVVVNSLYRKHGLGKLLIDHCIEYAKLENCYKIILNCEEKNIKFYEKSGFSSKNVEMSLYIH